MNEQDRNKLALDRIAAKQKADEAARQQTRRQEVTEFYSLASEVYASLCARDVLPTNSVKDENGTDIAVWWLPDPTSEGGYSTHSFKLDVYGRILVERSSGSFHVGGRKEWHIPMPQAQVYTDEFRYDLSGIPAAIRGLQALKSTLR